MNNSNKIILDLCGATGAWSKDYKDNGYTVINATLPKYDLFDEEVVRYCISLSPYGILAAPVCTDFSLARTRAKTPRNLRRGMKLVIACLNIVWECRYNNKLAFWCLENPMGYLRQFLGKPVMTFDPCDFGDYYTKKTDLWGYFNIPIKNPVNLNAEQLRLCSINNRRLPSISDFTGSKQSARRAITPPGFAQAFYEVNK